ncbi:glycosyltransferase involved in cell wall biosynthesis [Pseudarthrobacter enclensis]|uniref:D-inositol 3-phosphate glycosyltransferase n=2 Tax=Pseudarthrobacter enclensis TaxID=993070 RepID=A0ABT9RX56_9MICC|nr:glycosyltransferase involved in cell wall biosynthesis [Pseudarthrobacter enclensis]
MKTRRPLVVILQAYIPTYRAKFFEELIHRAGGRGIDVVVVAGRPSGSQSKRKDAVAPPFVVPLKQKEFRLLGRRVTLRKWPRAAAAADLVVLEQARRNIDVYRLLLPRSLRPTRIALWGHGADFAGSRGSFDVVLRKLLTRRADWFFAYSAVGGAAVQALGMPVERITELKNSTDTTKLRGDIVQLEESELWSFKELHSLGNNSAAYIGALDAGKRIELLIEAGQEIARRVPGFRLLIAGDGPLRSKVCRADSQYPWLTYIGTVDGSAKALLLASVKVLLIPGSVGLVAVDALTAGVPIVTTGDNAHGPEFSYLEPGLTAEVTIPEAAAYAGKAISLMNDDCKLALMRESCLEASTDYSVEDMADRFLEGLMSVFSDHVRV